MLHFTTMGEASALPPALLAHGLYGSGKNLGGIARRLAQDRLVISVDMRNHGDSFHSDQHSYPVLAEDLAEVIRANGGLVDLIGHSMGGKTAMTLALTQPELIRRLVALHRANGRCGVAAPDAADAATAGAVACAASDCARRGVPALQPSSACAGCGGRRGGHGRGSSSG